MYGIMPLEEYVANYDSILENKPFKFGNMKGKVLNKSRFFNDHSDYEVLLRENIPEKYQPYFESPVNSPTSLKKTNSDELDIEIGRSSNNLNLSPIKTNQENGVKDTEVLFKKSTKNHTNDVNLLKGKQNSNVSTTDYSLDLGDLNLKKKGRSSKVADIDIDFTVDNIDHLEGQHFKKLSRHSLEDNEGKKLNSMIQTLVTNLKDVKSENVNLRKNVDDLNAIVKDLNALVGNYKDKLRNYHRENKLLKLKLKNTLKAQNEKSIVYEKEYLPVIDKPDSADKDENIDIDEIDEKIRELMSRRESLQKQSQAHTPNLEGLSDEIVNKLLSQLKEHSKHDSRPELVEKAKNNENCPRDHSHDSTHDELRDDQHGIHRDCPFCEDSAKKASIPTFLLNSKNSDLSQEEIIELLAERLRVKMNIDASKSVPDIW